MKKTLLTLIAILAMSTTVLAQNIADLVGSYKGDLYIQLMEPINEESEALPNQSIKIEAGQGQSINFALYNFSFGNDLQLGDIILNNVGVKAEGKVVKFNDEKAVDLSFLGGAIQATAKINPTTSKIEGSNILVNLDVFWIQPGQDPTPIYVRFVGTKEASTGIQDIETAKSQQNIFTLNGVRVNQTLDQLPKGIYIVNGKKIIK